MPKATTKSRQTLSIKAHLSQRGTERVDPSPSLFRYWHARISRELFAGRLKPIEITYGPTDDDVYGLFFPDPYEPRIHLDARCRTRQALLDTLAHEMVHQYQAQQGLALTHGRLFQAWARKAAKLGLTL